MIIKDTDAHDIWHGTREAITETRKKLLGPKKHKHKEWISVRHTSEDSSDRRQEGSSQLLPDTSEQSGSSSRVHRSTQGSGREREERYA